MKFKIIIILFLSFIGYLYFNYFNISTSEPRNFDHAKDYVIKVYNGNQKTFYCGCDYRYTNKPSGQVDLEGCGYEIRAAQGSKEPSEGAITRAYRIEYEHVFPASWYGQQLDCWKEGGRSNCANDELFKVMESDIINLVPSIGQINGDRSNFWFAELNYQSRPQYGSCEFKVNFRERLVQPKKEIRGEIARIIIYMHDAYGIYMEPHQERLMVEWNNKYPISEWEIERNSRIKKLINRGNPYVSGELTWELGQSPTGFMLNREEQSNGLGFEFNKETLDKAINYIKRYL